MSEGTVYVCRSTMEKIGGHDRFGKLETGERVDYGLHGPMAEYYKLKVDQPRPFPVDYIVNATAGCMFGTLNAALEARGIRLTPDDLQCTVEGDNDLIDGLPQLKRIRVSYRMRIPAGTRETAEKALARHQDRCPTAAWMKGTVDVSWTAEIEEAQP
jgi:uncharacterized OsmC-like protein